MTTDKKFDIIKGNLKNYAQMSGRKAEDITIIAVTKTVPVDKIISAVEMGFCEIGENYVQEFLGKYDFLKGKVRKFHFIGHLQSNKVKYIIDKTDLIHSVDSPSLLKEINRQAAKINKIQEVLIEVNLTKEESKFGIYEEDVYCLLNESVSFLNVRIAGFMTMAPLHYSELEAGKVFKKLKKLFDSIENKDNIEMKYLSMGMSNDYKPAVIAGSNIIRLGTAIFGKR